MRTSWLSLGIFPKVQRKKISFGGKQLAETTETKRDPPLVKPERKERKKISGQFWVMFFLSFFLQFFLFFFVYYPLSRSRPSSSFYCFSRRRQTVANRIRGPLFTRSPATLCLLLTNFSRFFPFFPSLPHLFFSFISLTKSSYQRDPRNSWTSTFSWPRPDCSGRGK